MDDPEQRERDLLSRIAAGDREAFRALYLLYHRRLGGFLMRMVGSFEATEEIINDTLFVVWRKAGDFRGQSRVSTWILGIAYRHALKALRRRGSAPVAARFCVDVYQHDPPDTLAAEQRERRGSIDGALVALPPPQRLVIELTYFMGYSCQEIAEIAGCPVNTVKTRLHYARRRMRSILEENAGAAPGASGADRQEEGR